MRLQYYKLSTRQISVSNSKLEDDYSMQHTLFGANMWRNRKLGSAIDAVRSKYGSTALLRVSYTDAGTARHRDKLIGGHKAASFVRY